MIFLRKNHLVIKESNILAVKFHNFAISQYIALHFNINMDTTIQFPKQQDIQEKGIKDKNRMNMVVFFFLLLMTYQTNKYV